MNNEKRRVLIVDDSPDDIHFLMPTLTQDYAVLVATSGDKALEMATRAPGPDVVLMDVGMPGLNGYETCRRLKGHPDVADCDVIFVSAHDTTEERLAGYDAGGSDYLIKPVQPEELLRKVKLAISRKDERIANSAEKSSAVDMAMTALTNAGELGVVIDFMRRSFSTADAGALAELVVEVTANYGLQSSVRIVVAGDPAYASSGSAIRPLEKELLSRLLGAARITEQSPRLVLNFGEVSQLVKNMPEDEERRGRLRDHLSILLEGAEARVKALSLQKEMARVVAEANVTLLSIEDQQKLQQEQAVGIVDRLMANIEHAFLSYGMTEDQEQQILAMVQNSADESLENFERGLELDRQVCALVDRLAPFSSL